MDDLRTDLVVRRHGRALGEAPPLLLLHGLTDSGSGWADAVRRWESRFALVLVDQRGHGGSPRFTAGQLAGHPGEVLVEDVLGLLAQLPPAFVLGHSLGGAVALACAVRRPELVRGLVLEDPAPLGPGEPLRRPDRGRAYVDELGASRGAADDAALLRLRRAQHPGWPEAELLPTGRAEQEVDATFLAGGEWKPVTPWPELLAGLAVPALVVSGDRPDLCVDAPMEAALRDLGNPRLSLVRIAGAGHCVRRDRPEDFHAVVDAWLGAH